MAFPTVASVTASTEASNSTTSTVTLPGTFSVGDLFIGLVAADSGAGAMTWPAGWTEILDAAGTGFQFSVGYRIAQAGDTAPGVTHTTERSNHLLICVTGWHGTTAPEITTMATGSSVNPNSGSLTPSWGAADTLWITAAANDDSLAPTYTGFPYASNNNQNGTTASAARVAMATSETNAASVDPGNFTLSGVEDWGAVTIAVRPSAAAAVSGSFTADTYIKSTLSGSLTADTFIKNTLSGSLTADAYVKNVLSGSFAADAQIVSVTSGSFTADAHIKATPVSSFMADAYVKNTLSGSLTADAYVKKTLSGSLTADAQIGAAASAYETTILGTSGLIGYWRLNDNGSGSGNAQVIVDRTGSHNAVYRNIYTTTPYPTFRTSGAIVNDSDGSITKSTANWQYIEIADTPAFDLGDTAQSYELWFKRARTSHTDSEFLFAKGDGALRILFPANSNTLRISIWTGSTAATICEATIAITDTTVWYHLVVTKSGATTKLYINGVDRTGSVTNQTLTNTVDPIHIGAYDGDGWAPFAGGLDEVAIYNVALSQATVQQHYSAARPSIFSADAYVKATLSGSLTADAYVTIGTTASFSADAYVKISGLTRLLSADAYVVPSGLTLTATPDHTNGLAVVSALRSSPGAVATSLLYRKNALTGAWYEIASGLSQIIYSDVTAPIGVTYNYRVDTYNSSGGLISQTEFGSTLLTSDDWFLASDSIGTVRCQTSDAGSGRVRQQESFAVLGERYLDVQSGRLLGRSGTLSIDVATGDRMTMIANLKALADSSEPVYLKSPFGEVWWVAINGPRAQYLPVGHAAVSVNFTQVGEA